MGHERKHNLRVHVSIYNYVSITRQTILVREMFDELYQILVCFIVNVSENDTYYLN